MAECLIPPPAPLPSATAEIGEKQDAFTSMLEWADRRKAAADRGKKLASEMQQTNEEKTLARRMMVCACGCEMSFGEAVAMMEARSCACRDCNASLDYVKVLEAQIMQWESDRSRARIRHQVAFLRAQRCCDPDPLPILLTLLTSLQECLQLASIALGADQRLTHPTVDKDAPR